MKKIGIITFHRACNYGAVLQAFSLCSALNSYEDVSASLIDHRCGAIEKNYTVGGIFGSGSGLKTIFLKMLRLRDIIKRNRLFREFLHENLKLTSPEGLKAGEYHRFVTGSDQIWNLKLTGNDKHYFLDFAENGEQKVSYAASVGKVANADVHQLAELVSDFHGVGVREETLYTAMQSENCPHLVKTLDPVFLTSKENWKKISGEKPCLDGDYILVFIMGVTKQGDCLVELGKKLAKEKNCRVVLIGDQERWYKYRDVEHFGVASPAQFLNLIMYAKQVLTNSFHATAFSILLNTDFLVECHISSPERIDSLLELTGLVSHRLYDGKLTSGSLQEIDWETVKTRLEPEIDRSRNFIEKFIIE